MFQLEKHQLRKEHFIKPFHGALCNVFASHQWSCNFILINQLCKKFKTWKYSGYYFARRGRTFQSRSSGTAYIEGICTPTRGGGVNEVRARCLKLSCQIAKSNKQWVITILPLSHFVNVNLPYFLITNYWCSEEKKYCLHNLNQITSK